MTGNKVKTWVLAALTMVSFGVLATSSCTETRLSGSSSKAKNQGSKTRQGNVDDPTNGETDVTIPVGGSKKVQDVPGAGTGKIAKIESKDPGIATVDPDGTIHGVKPGTTTIEVTYEDGSTATVTVTVVDPGTEGDIDIGTLNPELDPGSLGGDDGIDPGTVGDTSDTPILIFKDGFAGTLLVKPLAPDSTAAVWAVTRTGNAYWLRLEGDAVAETKLWTKLDSSDGGGSRTYVTERGVVIARTGGHLFWIDPAATPTGELPKALPNYYRLPDAGDSDRVCIVSYRKNKKRYVGMGWGDGKFIEFPMDDKPPYVPQWGTATGSVTIPGVKWGYSCYIDQARLIFYSQWVNGSQGVGAVDLKTMLSINPSTAPNSQFKSTNIADATVGPAPNGSYAMNGDLAGNVFNGKGYYTLAHERGSRTVWGAAGGMLNIYPDKCLSKDANCVGQAGFLMAQINANVGPLSGLGDGRMIGMFRHSAGKVYLMKLKDKKDIAKGIDVTAIADLDGDPYMYTDFTGATLYLTKSDTTFELDSGDGFAPAKLNRAIGFTWLNRPGTDSEWKEMTFEIRCYASGGAKGDFQVVEGIKAATVQTIIKIDACAGKSYDRVDVRLTQLEDGDSLMNVAKVQVTAYQ